MLGVQNVVNRTNMNSVFNLELVIYLYLLFLLHDS
jgi:hypothetical protein